jgi:hypothetical protein
MRGAWRPATPTRKGRRVGRSPLHGLPTLEMAATPFSHALSIRDQTGPAEQTDGGLAGGRYARLPQLDRRSGLSASASASIRAKMNSATLETKHARGCRAYTLVSPSRGRPGFTNVHGSSIQLSTKVNRLGLLMMRSP